MATQSSEELGVQQTWRMPWRWPSPGSLSAPSGSHCTCRAPHCYKKWAAGCAATRRSDRFSAKTSCASSPGVAPAIGPKFRALVATRVSTGGNRVMAAAIRHLRLVRACVADVVTWDYTHVKLGVRHPGLFEQSQDCR